MIESKFDEYTVRKLNDTEGRHCDCTYFVLDLSHDPHALTAVEAYAEVAIENPESRLSLIDMARSYYRLPEEAESIEVEKTS